MLWFIVFNQHKDDKHPQIFTFFFREKHTQANSPLPFSFHVFSKGKEGINQWRREANQGAKHKARNPCVCQHQWKGSDRENTKPNDQLSYLFIQLIEPSPNIRLVLALAQKPIYPSIPIAAASIGRPELLHAVVLSYLEHSSVRLSSLTSYLLHLAQGLWRSALYIYSGTYQ